MRMNSHQDPVQQVLRKLYGKPCWNVQQGYSSFLTFEFGKPHLVVREPTRVGHVKSPRVRKALSRRQVWVHGEWHLWIYCCHWTIFQDGVWLAKSSSSSSKIESAARELQGQALVRVSVDIERGRSRFEFDSGGLLETRRYNRSSEQWILHDPTKHVLQVRGDGKYSIDHEKTRCNDTEWKPGSVNWKLV